jgi:hypothetical protein
VGLQAHHALAADLSAATAAQVQEELDRWFGLSLHPTRLVCRGRLGAWQDTVTRLADHAPP